MKDEIWRVIDYKTGNDIVTESLKTEELFSKPGKKVMLQLMFYAWLVKQSYPHVQVKAGMYKLRNVNQGVKWLLKGNVLTDDLMEEFEAALKNTINELFNPAIAFGQTDDLKRCTLCDFSTICGKNNQ